MGPVRLLIAVASGRGWCADFGFSLAHVMLNLGMNKLGGRLEDVKLAVTRQAYLVAARNDHMMMAIAEGFTHILYLDDDMTFPGDIVERLLAADKPVITCNYRKKNVKGLDYVCSTLAGEMLSSTTKTGLEQIGAMGLGMTLIKVDAVRNIPPPFFAVIWQKGLGTYLIEDGVFSLLLREHRVELWCDHDTSRHVGHVGEVQFNVPPVQGLTSLDLDALTTLTPEQIMGLAKTPEPVAA